MPIVFSKTANNTVDAAIAKVDSAILIVNATPGNGYGTPSSATVPATLGQPVQKYGRTTGLTHGTVTGINATVLVRYDTGTARFVQQVVIQPTSGSFSAGGDSGSLIVTDDGSNSPVALLFAGSSTTTIGNPIDLVLDAFDVTIDGTP